MRKVFAFVHMWHLAIPHSYIYILYIYVYTCVMCVYMCVCVHIQERIRNE